MRLTVKFRTFCLVGVAVVAVLAAGEALARGGGHSAGGHRIGGRGHGQHWGGGVHGGRVAHGEGRRPPSLAAIGVWALAAAAVTRAAITAAAGFIMTTLALTATTPPSARRPMAAGRRSMRSAIIQGRGLPDSDRGLSVGGLPWLCANRVLWLGSAHHPSSRRAASQGAQELQLTLGVMKR